MKSHAEQMKRKQESTAVLVDCFERSSIAILTDYRGEGKGLTVKEITDLRGRLRQNGGEYRVVKNTMARRAANAAGVSGLDDLLKGPVAIAFGYDDPAVIAKTVLDFSKESKEKKLPAVMSGYMEGEVLDQTRLQALADLPTRPQLLQQLLGLMLAPHRQIMGVMNAPGRQMATVIDAWRKKQEESNNG